MKVSEYLKLSNEDLTKELRRLNELYREGYPQVSDEIYDYLFDTLKERDPMNPFFKEVGAPVVDEKFKVELPYKMFSLDKIKNEEKPLQLWKSKFPNDVLVSAKLDGNSGLFYVKNGKMSLMTRGDGYQGQDISYLLPYIQIFKSSKTKDFILTNFPELAIRGELILSKIDWESISKANPSLSNPRNAVAGTLNAKAPNATILSKIKFIAYELVSPVTNNKPSETFEYMKNLGLHIVENSIIKKKDVSVESLSKYLLESRDVSDFEIDGIVVTENIPHSRDETGNPKYSFAFKSLITQEQVEVTVTNVEWNVSKDGVLKPLVHFPKVNLNGVDIQKATGFNAKFIEEHRIGPGSTIVIIRSGDVIPHILQVLKESPTGAQFPDISYVWNATHVDIKINVEDAKDEILDELELKRLVHFFVKLDTEGVAEGVVKKLYEAGFITVKSILNSSIEDLVKVEGIQQRSAEKIRMNLDIALEKATPLKLMVASNMFESGFGERKIKPIITAYPNIIDNEKRYIPSVEELLIIGGVAEITANNFITNIPNFWNFVDENELNFLMKVKVISKSKNGKDSLDSSGSKNPFLQQTFVFSGIRKKEWESQIESAGGKVATSVSKNTNVLIVKDMNESTKDSSKIVKAKELNIPIYTVEEVENNFN